MSEQQAKYKKILTQEHGTKTYMIQRYITDTQIKLISQLCQLSPQKVCNQSAYKKMYAFQKQYWHSSYYKTSRTLKHNDPEEN